MRLTKRFRGVGLMMISLLLASLTLSAQTQKWNSEDWDDDLVLDSVEDSYDVLTGDSEKDPYIPGKLNPMVGPLAANRALVLGAVQPNGVKLPVATRFMPSSDCSVEFWYSPVASASNANGSLFSYVGDKNSYSIDVTNGVLSVNIGGTKIGSASLEKYATVSAVAANPQDNNIWNYIALTWKCADEDNTYTATLYLNGAKVATLGSIPALDVDISSEAYIGKGCASGYIDEFSFWSKALTDSEISADYNNGNGKISYYEEGDKHGLVCYYRFDDGGESIEDYAYLPDFEAAAALDPTKATELEMLTAMFQYRVMAADNNVRTTAIYKDAAKTELIQKGQPVWLTNLSVSMAEPELLRTKEADVDSDYDGFVNDGDTDLSSSILFALVRVKGDDALKNITLLQGGNFIVYDDLGKALWVVRGFDKNAKLDAPQLSYGNKEVTCAQFATNLSSPEADFTDGMDDDGDGVIDDTCIAKGNLAAAEKPAIDDADDDGIVDNDERKGIDPLCKAKITRYDYSTSPLYNRVLDLTETGTRYASPAANYTNNNMYSNGFTLELWYKLAEKPDGSATKYPLIYKTNVKPTLPGDFWFGFEADEKDGNKMKLTVKYRTIANTTISETVVHYTLNEIDLLDPELGWVHVAVTVVQDEINPDAMKANFVVFAKGAEYKSDSTQHAGVIGEGSGLLDNNTSNKNGKLIIGSTKSAESLKMFVDEVRIWNGAVSATELSANRHMFLDTIPYNLTTYYRFDDGANVSGRNTIQDFVADLSGVNASTTDAALVGKAKVTMLPSAKQGDETFEYLNADSDRDKIPDFWEIAAFQSLAGMEYAISSDVHSLLLGIAGTGRVAGRNWVAGHTDYDGDGLNDYYEFRTGHDPMVDDTNAVTFNEETGKYENDLTEYDADGDGLSLLDEQRNGTNPNEYNTIDGGSGAIVSDTDDDGISDDDEDTGNTGDDPFNYTVYELTGKYDPLSPLVWRALKTGGTEADKLVIPENTATVYGADVNTSNVEAQNWTLEAWFNLEDDENNTGSLIRRVRKDGTGTYFDLGLENGVPYVKATMQNEFSIKGLDDSKKTLTKELVLQPTTGSAIAKNTWTHFVAEWDARHQTMSIFLNGTFAGSVFCFGAPLIDGGDYSQFTTELLGDVDGKYLKGYIDEVRIWTYASSKQNGIRHPNQIKEWMSKVLPILRANTALNNMENIPTAYFRFDDGGKYAQNFSTVADQTDPSSYYTMTLQDASGNDADLTERMVSVWDGDKTYDEANVALRAVNMSGAGNDEFDPIPDGWKQIYWPNSNVGSKYDFNLEFVNISRTTPSIFPGESSSFIDPLTGEIATSNGGTDRGGRVERRVYFTDIYFNDVSGLESVNLAYYLGGYADGSGAYGNRIYIFVNGERIGYTNNSNGLAGEDYHNSIVTQVNGQNAKGNFGYYNTSTSPMSDTVDIKQGLVKGRNRITILTEHVPADCTTSHSTTYGENHDYRFTANIRVNGRIPDNELSHVKWFFNDYYAVPDQEDTDHCHAKQKDGVTDLLYFWFEKYYAVQPWAFDQDPDGDGLTNWTEYLANTNPLSKVNGYELMFDSERDHDGDMLSNQIEQYLETLPNVADTDDDGVDDYTETTSGYSPSDSSSVPDRKNQVLKLNGRTVFAIPEVGDVSGQDDLSQWTIEAWIKPEKSANGKKQVILARTIGRYVDSDGKNVDCTNYELGLTEEGLPYAGFTVVKDYYSNGKLIGVKSNHIYTNMTTAGGFTKLADGVWTHLVASFSPMAVNSRTGAITSGKIQLYVNGQLAYTLNNVMDIAPTTYRGVAGLTIGMPLPQDGEIAALADDETKTVENSFIGEIDNLAVWTKVRALDEIRDTQRNGFTNIVKQSKTFLFYNWKVPVPYLRTDASLLHAFTFDDGGTSIENYAWKQDWYNGFAHAIPLPLDIEMDEAIAEDVSGEEEEIDDELVDTDGDGLPDSWENQYPSILNPQDPSDAALDPDHDGLTNWEEYLYSTDPTMADTDFDGLPDGFEILYPSILDPLDPSDANLDSDSDGITNTKEYLYGTNPANSDTDGDGLPDGWEVRYTASVKDADGNPIAPSLNPLSADGDYGADGDPDHDGFTNMEEYLFGTNPIIANSLDADTDGDGIKDVIERRPGVNTVSTLTDTDDDEEDDYTEISLGTKGYDSTSKSTLATYTKNFLYEGNKVAQVNVAHGPLTVPDANDPDRIGFASWTVEARFRHTEIDAGKNYTVNLVRRSYANKNYSANKPVPQDDGSIAWNYAIGYEIKSGEVYPFVSFKANGSIRKIESEEALDLDTVENGKTKTGWHFVTGAYDSIAKQMYLYVDGELKASKTFKSITSTADQCPSNAKLAGDKSFTATKIGEIFTDDYDTSIVMIDEVRIWGLKANTVEAAGTNTGYIANFIRSAGEITEGHLRPVTPIEGVYDGGLADQYVTTDASGNPLGGNTVDYAVDNHVSDGAWTTKTGAVGIRAIVSYHDENDNGMWDPGEDIWRDQTLADAIAIASTLPNYDPTTFEKLTEADVTINHYEELVDVKLAQGKNGWKPGTAYTRTVVNGTTTSTVSVTAEQSAVGNELVVYYIDKNNNGQIDAEDDFWVDYDATRDVDSWYVAAPCGWAKRMGLALYYRFDDGGGSIEDYAWQADWRSSPVWAHAIRPTDLSGTFPPKNPTDKGGIAYQYVTKAFADGFVWVKDASLPPQAPEAEIYALSNGNKPASVAYIPKTAGDLYDYDVLSAHISRDAVDPESGNITYLYYWLFGADWDGKLAYVDGELVADNNPDDVISSLIATGKDLDLFVYADIISAGDTITLAVVAKSESGQASPVVISTIDVVAKNNAMPEPVVFSHWNAKPATAGQTITVTLTVQDSNPGTVVINWYRNLTLFSKESRYTSGVAGRTVSFSINSSSVVDGDVWSYKAHFEASNGSISRTTPPESANGNEWIFCPVGVGYDEYNAATSNSAPSIPRNVVITPEDVDENSMLIATASGSSDPDGDKFAYMYQWYQNGTLVAGETMPFFPYLTENKTITELDGETQTTLNATKLAEGDIIMVRVWAVDVYGNASNKLISDPVIIGPDLAEINDDIGDAGTIYAYEPNNTSKKATRLLPKADWSDADDASVQEHYFCDKDDVDWFWFIVPQTLTSNKSIVKLETNNGEQMYYPTHFLETGNEIDDTYMELYDSSLKRLASNDDTRLADGRGTVYARMEVELEPGLYYVRVSRSGSKYYSTMWTMHLGIMSERGSQGPAFDTGIVVLTPDKPSVASDLTCTASGAVSSSGRECEYYYVWYRNGELVPFGTVAELSAWSTARFVISQAKNFGSGQPNVVESKYTKPGDIWWCDVYAKDEYGYSEPVQSNWVIVEGEYWAVELQVYKTFRKAGMATVSGSDQSIVIGMDNNATFGFDPSLDIAAATRYLPGTSEIDYSPLPLGAAYSIGMDNTCTKLTRDIRPFGRSSVWYIRIDMGDPKSSIDNFMLSWAGSTLPKTAVGGLKLTRMIQLTDKTWEPVPGTTIDMMDTSTTDYVDFVPLQQDEYGQYYAVYRIALGGADEKQTISLKPGWNMISFAVTPLNNAIDDVFTVNSTKLIRGNAWRYEGGQYVAAATINAGVGYWIYANIKNTTTLTVNGNRPAEGIELKAGWNLVGPLYNVVNVSKTYADIYKYGSTVAPISYIYKAISDKSGNIKYEDIYYSDKMDIGNAYWIFCNKDVTMPFEP